MIGVKINSVARTVVAVGLVALALTACGSSAAHNATTQSANAPAGSGSKTPSAGSTANAAPDETRIDFAAASQGEPLAPLGCGAIPIGQANALVTTPMTSVDYSPNNGTYYPDHHFRCDAGMQIEVYPRDSSKSDYTTDLGDENVAPTSLAGIADTAVFTQSGLIVQGAGPMPDVYVPRAPRPARSRRPRPSRTTRSPLPMG